TPTSCWWIGTPTTTCVASTDGGGGASSGVVATCVARAGSGRVSVPAGWAVGARGQAGAEDPYSGSHGGVALSAQTPTAERTRGRPEGLHAGIERVLFDEDTSAAKVREIAATISRDYATERPLVVGILNGCFPFIADLVRAMEVPLE